jgi:hypothetical protein
MFKIMKRFISTNNKKGNMHSYFKTKDDIEYFKINIGNLDYYVKTVQGNLQTFFVYDTTTKLYRHLNTREQFKLSVEFKKEYSFFKVRNILRNNNNLLPYIFYNFESDSIN